MYIKTNENMDIYIQFLLDRSLLKLKYDRDFDINFITRNINCESKIFFFILNLMKANEDEIGPSNIESLYYVCANNFPLIILVDSTNMKLINLLEEFQFADKDRSNNQNIRYIIHTKDKFSEFLKLNDDTIRFQNDINKLESEIKLIGQFTERFNRRNESREIIYKMLYCSCDNLRYP